MKKVFLDSNIIVYANDKKDRKKQKKAIQVITMLLENHAGVISTQVLSEYANVAIKKLRQHYDVVLRQIKILENLEIVSPSISLLRRGIEIMQTYKISFWDAQIISQAESTNCDIIVSEDFNTGQFYAGLKIDNPFI